MSLIDRLSGVDERKIPVHQFYAALAEFAAGEVIRSDIVNFFELDSGDDAELDVIIAGYTNAAVDRKQEYLEFIHRMFILAEVQTPGYNSNAALAARIGRF